MDPPARFVRRDEPVPPADVNRIKKRPNWYRRTSGAALIGLVLVVLWSAGRNEKLGWGTVGEFLFADKILQGVAITVWITVISQLLAMLGGSILALMAQSSNVVARWVATAYIWLFRGVPLIVQIIFWFNISIVIPRVTIGIPGGPTLGSWTTNSLISGFTAALLGLSLNESAYMAEIIRGGILGVDRGQTEASLALGMTRGKAMRQIVLPQTLRIVLPPTGNQFIGLLKSSSLVAVVGGGELLTKSQQIYGQNFAVIPLLIVASLWYLVLTSIATVGQHYLERAVAVDGARRPSPTLRRRLSRNLAPGRVQS
jgi:polar amino acid transport system permease protein